MAPKAQGVSEFMTSGCASLGNGLTGFNENVISRKQNLCARGVAIQVKLIAGLRCTSGFKLKL
jgi:hypothetical protein